MKIGDQEWVLVPHHRDMTDDQAEAVAGIASCCGGIAYDTYRVAQETAPKPEIDAMVEGVAIALDGCDSDGVGWLNTSESYKNILRYRSRAVLRHLFGEG